MASARLLPMPWRARLYPVEYRQSSPMTATLINGPLDGETLAIPAPMPVMAKRICDGELLGVAIYKPRSRWQVLLDRLSGRPVRMWFVVEW
jgi:hypothetical protein